MGATTRSVVVLVVAVVVLIGGLMRLLWDTPKLDPTNFAEAVDFARCFSARAEIAANTPSVTVAPLEWADNEQTSITKISPPPARALTFRVSTPLTIDIPDAAIRDEIQKGATQLPVATRITVAKTKDEFDFLLQSGSVAIRHGGSHALLTAKDPIRFGPVEKASYEVTLAKDTLIETKPDPANPTGNNNAGNNNSNGTSSRKLVVLPAGTTGTLDLRSGQALVPLQPLAVSPWLYQVPPTLVPTRAVGRKGLGDIAIEARQPGFLFDAPNLTLLACLSADKKFLRTGVTETKAQEPGAATVTINIPTGVLPAFSNGVADIVLAVASSDGQFMALGAFRAIGRPWAAGGALVLTGLLFAWILQLRREKLIKLRQDRLQTKGHSEALAKSKAENAETGKARWFAGLFIDADGQPSLSLFQIFVWTVITVWGLAYVFVVTGSLISLTPEMMGLLGIAGTGSVLARWISNRGEDGAVPAPADKQEEFEFWKILSTNGQFDLLKLQLFVFTLMIALYVIWRILDTAAFPALDANTLLLLGISQGVYIGGKLAGTTALNRAQTAKLTLDVRTGEKQKLVDEQATLTTQQTSLRTAGKDLDPSAKQRLDALPELITAKAKEIAEADTAYQKAVKDLGLKPA